MERTRQHALSVLLADDDDDDRFLFQEAVAEITSDVHLQMVKDGDELMHYLLTSAVVLPEVLFLDLNMPKKTGSQCLEEIRKTKGLQGIFIIIYTTTARPVEIEEVYSKGANLFIHKPRSFTELKRMLSQIFSLNLQEHFAVVEKEEFVFV